MAWFKRSSGDRRLAVVSPVPGGAGALRLEGDTRRPRLAAFAWRHTPQAGADTLNQLAQQIGARDIPLAALLDTSQYQTVLLEAPPVPEEELMGAVRWKIRDMINFHIDDAVLDHVPVPAGGGRTPSLYVVAARSVAVRALANPFHEAGLHLEVIDVRESAQNALAALLAPADYAVALLHMEDDAGLLTFTFGPDLILSRRIDGRGASGDFLNEKVALEVQRSVDYFERQYSWFPLAKLYLAPMAGAAPLRAKLAELLPVGVEQIDLDSLFDLGGVADLQTPERQNEAFHLLGAALREAPHP
jgi:MSHA biogenesis protein MshI